MNIINLTLSQKIGQMLCFAFHGTDYNEHLKTLINELEVGGVIYFGRNIGPLPVIHQTNLSIQSDAKIPLFIGLDQEGGAVLRITDGITPFPGAMSLAASGVDSTKLVRSVGEDLVNLGFNMVFAPVGDVNNNPLNPVINSRSYSDDPKVVSRYASYAFKGFQEAKILPTIKHFPGHGDTSVDSHLSLPKVSKTKEEVEKIELVPFQDAIDNGIDGVMMSHILYESFDNKYPASLSYEIITNLLRKKMGFNGLVVTDSLTMGAIHTKYTNREIVRYAANAGVDLLIFCGKATLEEQREIKKVFIEEVENGNISIERIDESVQRILDYKAKYYHSNISLDEIEKKDHSEIIKVSEAAITLVKDDGKLPIKQDEKVLIVFPNIKTPGLQKHQINNKSLVLENIVDNVDYSTLGKYMKQDEVILRADEELDIDCEKYDKIVFVTYNVQKDDYQVQFFNKLDKEKTIVVSLRSPYDINHLFGLKSYICAYEPTDLAVRNVKKALMGEIEFLGKIPVKL